jgi:tRNA threonylcarbamoyladenosine biosynthesis protein TsaE
MKTVDYPPSQVSASFEETIRLGEKLGVLLEPGSVVALSGGLGAGKTCFTKGIALALGVEGEIISPSYMIMYDYEGRVPLRHIDTYRLLGGEDFDLAGGREMVFWEGITVVEWPEKIAAFLTEAIRIRIDIIKDGRRLIRYGDEHTGL